MLADGGKIDPTRFEHYAEMVALFNQYSDPALLTSGTYDQQILGFASGKYAFVTQGSWIGATMTSDDKEQYEAAGSFKVGMIPYAFEEGIDTILTNSPSWWAVFENDNTQKAKDFLTWLAGDEGQKFLVELMILSLRPSQTSQRQARPLPGTGSRTRLPWTRTSSASSILTTLWATSRMQLPSHRLFPSRLQLTTHSNCMI